MKKIFYYIIGFISATVICVTAGAIYYANDIKFSPNNTDWNVNNIEDAVNDLYSIYNSYNYCEYANGQTWEFNYTGSYQSFVVPCKGEYSFEVYGASGGDGYYSGGSYSQGGKGGYVYTKASLIKGTDLYIYVGEAGSALTGRNSALSKQTFNGGGAGTIDTDGNDAGGNGGGASDIRLVYGAWNDENSLYSRLIVAGGGGAGMVAPSGVVEAQAGNNGGNVDKSGEYLNSYYSGLQLYKSYKLGVGQDSVSTIEGGAGGGGGYYGGASYTANGRAVSGAGGTSYVSGCNGCDTTYLDYQKVNNELINFTNTTFTQGVRSGNGYVKITLVNKG